MSTEAIVRASLDVLQTGVVIYLIHKFIQLLHWKQRVVETTKFLTATINEQQKTIKRLTE